MTTTTETPTKFLYQVPDAEVAYNTPEDCFEAEIAPYLDEEDRRPWTIEKWTARPAREFLPHPGDIAEHVAQHASDEMRADGAWEPWETAMDDPEVVEAFRTAMELMTSKVAYSMCGEKVGEHTVTWTDDGEPLLDGQPIKVKAEAAR